MAASNCTYVVDSTAIKWRWSLTMDAAKRDRVSQLLAGQCGQRQVQVYRA